MTCSIASDLFTRYALSSVQSGIKVLREQKFRPIGLAYIIHSYQQFDSMQNSVLSQGGWTFITVGKLVRVTW
jgi:hypothetical protein